MRGNLKNDEFFSEKLVESDEEITDTEDLVAEVSSERGEDDIGVQNGYELLAIDYRNRINLLYTSGTRDNDICNDYRKLLLYYAKTWDPEDSYFELIKVLSLAVLLDVDAKDKNLTALMNYIKESCYTDYLVDKFLYYIDNGWEGNSTEFKWPNTYETLKNVAECEDKTQATILLQDYLNNEWYGIHRECAWYDTHKSSKTVYYGYWSFESGALAKILSLNDSSLKGQAYYPYDLVHRCEKLQ